MKKSESNKEDFALVILDVQQKIINPIQNHDVILSNIELLLRSYEILRENICFIAKNCC